MGLSIALKAGGGGGEPAITAVGDCGSVGRASAAKAGGPGFDFSGWLCGALVHFGSYSHRYV